MDEEEKMDEIRKMLKKDLGISDKDVKEVMENVERKKRMKKIMVSTFAVMIEIAIISIALFIALSEKNIIYWTFAFIVIGLLVMEILTARRKLNPEKAQDKNPVKYCAQITDSSGSNFPNIRKQSMFSDMDEAEMWIKKIAKEGEGGRVIDTANGRIIKKNMGGKNNG